MPGGRPSKIDQPAKVLPDGTELTIGEAVVRAVGLGQEYTAAAKGAGISTATLHTWRVNGARARTAQLRGRKITQNDAKLAAFLDALERAESEAELERLGRIAHAAQPQQIVKVVEKVQLVTAEDGTVTEHVVERTTTTETRPGQWTADAWWLERRMPHRYARRLELSGPEGGAIPIEDRARTLADSLAEFLTSTDESGEAAEAAATVRRTRTPKP